jgi:hypothetical protein
MSGNQTLPAEQNEPAVVKFIGPKDVLTAARKLIETPAMWGKGMRGISPNRRPMNTCCAAEAIETVDPHWGSKTRRAAFDIFIKANGISDAQFRAFTDWNDAPERTHAEVLAAFDRAIAECGA